MHVIGYLNYIFNKYLAVFLLALFVANSLPIDIGSPAYGTEKSPFVVLPYIQLGNNPKLGKTESLEIMWMSQDENAKWSVEISSPPGSDTKETKEQEGVKVRPVDYYGLKPLFIMNSSITGLKPGAKFQYRVLRNGKQVFVADALARKPAGAPFRFAVFGDIAAGTEAQKAIAWQCYKAKPDLIVIPGDIVYPCGRLSEYLQRFFPVYNSSGVAAGQGVPLMRSTLWVAAAGNHDIGLTGQNIIADLNMFPDALAYFLVWSQPLNGPLPGIMLKSASPVVGARRDAPVGGSRAVPTAVLADISRQVPTIGSPNNPTLKGSLKAKLSFMKAAGPRYPRMANFSFDYGNSHFMVLDANFYMDWTNPKLRQWVDEDLLKAKDKRWKLVSFHQPGFSCDRVHFKEQRMRLLSDIFEKRGVDVVFCGHAHDYQRSFPLHFRVKRKNGIPVMNADGTVDGDFSLDYDFDGNRDTMPNGVVYIVTGAGGAALRPLFPEDPKQFSKTFPWVAKFNNHTHSLTVCDATDKMLKVTQISKDGTVLDQFKMTKNDTGMNTITGKL